MKSNHFNWIFILGLWLVCTAINLNKPFHIDDAFHLEAAKWIADHPLEPMSGTVNWTDVPEPVHHFNQPPVYLYLVAVAGELFGYSEIPLHLLQSIFTLLAIFFFYRISLIVCPKYPKFLTLLFAFCPAFLVNQNLMTDVPLVALSLMSVYLLIRPSNRSRLWDDALSALILGVAVLTKYTLLPLLVVLPVSILWRKQYMNLVVLLIPFAMIGLWSWWNLEEFGKIHILGRERDPFEIGDILGTSLSFMACLGAVAPFTLAMFSGLFRKRRVLTFIIVGIFFLFIGFMAVSWFGLITAGLSKEILRYLFLLNGMLLTFTILYLSVRRFGHMEAILFFWFIGIAAFVIRYSPFIATRHILLIVPPALLICSRIIDRIAPVLKLQAAVAAILLGVLLGISDWLYADFYRKGASEVNIVRTGNEKIWTAGHWGWQWYSGKQGMLQYTAGSGEPREGDWLVIPSDIARQKIDTTLKLVPVRKIWHEAGPFTFISTSFNAGFYMSTYLHPAWRLSRLPVDTITVYRIIRN